MLLDLHTTPGDLEPAELARAAADAGLDGVLIVDTNRTDRLDAFRRAVEKAGLRAFVGVELLLDRGRLVFVPRTPDDAFFAERWSPGTLRWALDAALDRVRRHDGALLAAHPYQRDLEPMGDRVYAIADLTGVETRVGRGRPVWDDMADDVAAKRALARVGSCGGDPAWLGRAVTVIPGDLEDNADLVDALREGRCWPVEFEDPARPRDRRRPAAPPPEERREREDRPPRGRRDRDRGGRDRKGRGGDRRERGGSRSDRGRRR